MTVFMKHPRWIWLGLAWLMAAPSVLSAQTAPGGPQTAQREFLAGLVLEYRPEGAPDYPAAAARYEAAAAAGSREALWALARLSAPDGPLKAGPELWRDRLLAASRAGWPEAAHRLAQAVENNQVPSAGLNPAGLYYQAAAAGYAPSARRLGEMYLAGQSGLSRDAAQGALWLTVAAENHDGQAALDLGRLYYDQKPAVAVRWLTQAKVPEASYLLGQLYLRDKRFTEGLEALTSAADRGFAPAHLRLGKLNLDNDFGRVPNPRAALRHFKIAAQAELPEGAYYLARMYLGGQGTPKDSITGAFWLHQAAAWGYEPARTEYDKLALNFSPGQKKRLERMIEEGVAPTTQTQTK